MFKAISDFFNSDEFMPHGHCFLWEPKILWLHVISDAAIALSYYTIPIVLVYFVVKRKDLPFDIIFWLFGAFIFLCGTSHLMGIWVLWHPDYALEGVIKAMTGIASIATFFVIIKLIPKALSLASPTQLAKLNEQLQQNIIERDAAQNELQGAYNNIEKKVIERTEELNSLLIDFEKSNQELDDFAYIVSHDLKEPLRGLHNQATFLAEDYKEKLGADGLHRLERMSYLSKRMEKLINDLLYFSRLGKVDLAVKETDLNEVIYDIEKMMEVFLKEKNAHIIIAKSLPKIVCDGPRIAEVFRNLITNAVKYNDKDKRLVEIGCLENANTQDGIEKKIFYVKDNGIGVDQEFYDEIFHMFRRLTTQSTDDEGGTGVGLTFVKKIIEKHGGKIWLESASGKGTTFYFTLGL